MVTTDFYAGFVSGAALMIAILGFVCIKLHKRVFDLETKLDKAKHDLRVSRFCREDYT